MFGAIDREAGTRALLAGAASVLGSYAASGFAPEFVVAPVAGALTRLMPGAVVTFAITVLGDLGQQLNLLGAIGIAVVGLGLLAALGIRLGRSVGGALPVALATGGVIAGGVGLATGSIGSSLGAGVSAAAVAGAGESWDLPVRTSGAARRRFLRSIGTLVGVGALAGYLGSRQGSNAREEVPAGGSKSQSGTVPANVMDRERVREAVSERLQSAAEKSLDVDGMDPLVSEAFYEVDINTVNPDPSAESWELGITGVVEDERTVTFDDLAGMEPEHRFATLRCVGEPLNGEKMDTALWTGVPIRRLLERADPKGQFVMVRAVDDYFEEFPYLALRDGFLAYGMNGDPLPRKHGYPVRVLVPGHWGEINVKWVEEIEFLDREAEGFWERRGWQGTGPVNPVAKIHAVNRDVDNGRIQVGGHAYAGTRGVGGVEVSTDGGDSWQAATLSEALPGEDVWRQWVHEYESPGRKHEVVARMIDGEGLTQTPSESPPYPSGPSGWVSKTVRD